MRQFQAEETYNETLSVFYEYVLRQPNDNYDLKRKILFFIHVKRLKFKMSR